MNHSSVTVEQRHLWLALRQWAVGATVCGLILGLDQVGALKWLRGGVERGILIIDTKVLVVQTLVSMPGVWWSQSRDKSVRLASLEYRLAQSMVDRQNYEEMRGKVELLESLVVKVGAGQKASQIAQLMNYGDRVMLALGEGSGIIKGQMMTDKQGILVGQISQVGRYMSQVKLLDDMSSRVRVQTIDGTTRGIVEGKGTTAELVGVLQTENLSVGDILVTSGADGNYPPGIVVGQVVSLVGKPEDVTKGGGVNLMAEHSGWVALW